MEVITNFDFDKQPLKQSRGKDYMDRLELGVNGLTLTPAWISTYTHYKRCDKITNQFLNFNGATFEVWEWISNFFSHFFGGDDYLSMLQLRLTHVSKRDPW